MKNLIEFNGTCFSEGTSETVMKIINNRLGRYDRLRFWYGDKTTGKSWNEENDTTGYIGRSGGNKKIPLLIKQKNSIGGGAILTDCIVKIVDTKTNMVLYQHEKFNQSVFSYTEKSDLPQYVANVLQDGEIYARCKSVNSAIRLTDFMNGKRHNK